MGELSEQVRMVIRFISVVVELVGGVECEQVDVYPIPQRGAMTREQIFRDHTKDTVSMLSNTLTTMGMLMEMGQVPGMKMEISSSQTTKTTRISVMAQT